MCFGCSPNNHSGIHLTFYEDGDDIVSVWQPKFQFQGWHNTLHGGIQSLLMDEIAAWTVAKKLQTTGVTSKMEVRFRKALYTTDKYIVIRASISEIKRNFAVIKVAIYNHTNELCASAECTYFTFTKEKAEEMKFFGCEVEDREITMEELISEVAVNNIMTKQNSTDSEKNFRFK